MQCDKKMHVALVLAPSSKIQPIDLEGENSKNPLKILNCLLKLF